MNNINELAHSQWQPVLEQIPHWSSLDSSFELLEKHGDFPDWQAALTQLPEAEPSSYNFKTNSRFGSTTDLSADALNQLETALLKLHPWRKGPFTAFGLHIDTEWRSDWKWDRVLPHLSSLRGKMILDVGCGNGYYGWRMLAQGARTVIGIDPTAIFLMQHLALSKYCAPRPNYVLPLRLEALPPGREEFDNVFSMGVIYHSRDPQSHTDKLYTHLRSGGELILETLVTPDTWTEALIPNNRYARMRNVWQIPTQELVLKWLKSSGFSKIRVVDVSTTSLSEQRSTQWMTFESLAACLDPKNSKLTIEGHPAPIRAVFIASKAN